MMKAQYLNLLKVQLAQLASQSNFESIITTAFGTNIEAAKISQLRQDWLAGDFSVIPQIEILSNGELGGANGGYAASEDKIFISSDFLAQQQDNTQAVTGLLLEEIGHKIDRVFNGDVDSAGDEGDIFSRLASGQTLSTETLASLKVEDDSALITVGGKVVSIEQQVINGTAGMDFLIGTAGDDTLSGYGDNDTLLSGSGNDILLGGIGNDTLFGEADNDTLYGDAGDDYLYGGDGKDNLYGGNDSDRLYGDSGNDYLVGEAGDDYLYGGDGDDILAGEAGSDSLYGNANNDRLVGGTGDDLMSGGDGDDILYAGAGIDFLYGNAGNDTLYSDADNDLLNGGAGNDTYRLLAFASDSGVKTIDEETDTIVGGKDTLDFSSATTSQSLYVDLSKTTIQALTPGLQLVIPTISIENIYGGAGSDSLRGNNFDNYISAGDGFYDYLYGAAGNDTLYGENGGDTLYGEDGNDGLYGGAGDDGLHGGAGDDLLYGGAGYDLFYFGGSGVPLSGTATVATTLGKDTIGDFVRGTDQIILKMSTFTNITADVNRNLTNTKFATVANDAAALTGTSSAAILYSSSTGNLFYNQNGTLAGLGTSGGNFATLTGLPNLMSYDFLVVW
jgi:Ca2+-binding RTX toxin-like protein